MTQTPSDPNDRPTLLALIEKYQQLAGVRKVHHPDAPLELEASIAQLKRFSTSLLGYDAPVVVHKLPDRWLIDVARRGTASSFSYLRILVASTDRDLGYREPSFDWEFRVEGRRFPELVQDHRWSRTRFLFESPPSELREVVFTFQNALTKRFGEEPFLNIYARGAERFDVYVDLGNGERNVALEGRLRSLVEMVRIEHPLLDFGVFVDRAPLADGRALTASREHEVDLAETDFPNALRLR